MKWAIIFDVDGVVADTETINAKASVKMFKELYDVDVKDTDFKPFIGRGDERYVSGVAEKYRVKIDVEAAVDRRKENFFKLLKDEPLPAMPGVMELVKEALDNPNIAIAIATSGNKDKQFPVIQGAGLKLEWFDSVITGDDITKKKPNPQIYLLAAKRLGVKPSRCVVFEDAPPGVKAAKAAGMKCVAITSSTDAEKLKNADIIVDSLAKMNLKIIEYMLLESD